MHESQGQSTVIGKNLSKYETIASDDIKSLLKLLPKYEEIESILEGESEAAYIIHTALAIVSATASKTIQSETTEEASYLIQCLVDKCWERIHTGHFTNDVPLAVRKIYAIACYLKSQEKPQMEKCNATLDDALLVGCTEHLYARSAQLEQKLMQHFDQQLDDTLASPLLIIEPTPRVTFACDIPQIDRPSVHVFSRDCYVPRRPALLLNSIAHWPALKRWRDLNYIDRLAGNRTVPIEIGSNYANDEWSQQLVKLRDFLQRQFSGNSIEADEIEYLAQHELFEQIPALKVDICVPDYCTLSEVDGGVADAPLPAVDIKAWLGPKGTISPLHYDPKHNLLCQVFGQKQVILAADTATPLLYAHASEMLANTSQIDAAAPDYDRFPLLRQVRFLELTLQAGDCLYIPPKWWHYVRAETPSFSVSFWWE